MTGIQINNEDKSLDVKILKNTTPSQGILVQNDLGLTIQNAAGSNSVPLTASGTNQLTAVGNLIVGIELEAVQTGYVIPGGGPDPAFVIHC